MKKTLIAAAVTTAFAGSAMAQATVSGVLDFGHGQTKTTQSTTISKTSESPGEDFNAWTTSRVNFAATEDLGGGLKAGAQVQMGLSESGSTSGSDRDTFVFVSGGFGHVSLGTRETAINTAFDKFNVVGTTNGYGTISMTNQDAMAGTLGNGTSAARGTFARQRGLQFTTPSFSGFSVGVDYSNNSSEVNTLAGKTGQTMHALTVNYSAGPLSFAVATGEVKTKTAATAAVTGRAIFFNSTNNATATATTTSTTGAIGSQVTGAKTGWTAENALGGTAADALDNASVGTIVTAGTAAAAASEAKAKTSLIGLSYNLGVAEFRLGHTLRKDESANATVSDVKVTTLGVSVPMGNVRLFASGYDGSDDRTSSTTDDVDMDGRQIGLTYSLSKRTMAYAYTGKNDRKAKSTGVVERKDEGTYFGIVHSF